MLGFIRVLIVFVLYFPMTSGSMASSAVNMELIGKGEAYYLKFIKVYDASLYSDNILAEDDILNSDVSKCLHLHYAVGVDKEDFITAANTVLARQFTPERLERVASEIASLHDGYRDVDEGDIYTLCYNETGNETVLSLNGDQLVTVTSQEFAEIYFSIWLGATDPLDNKLRNNLLAKVLDK